MADLQALRDPYSVRRRAGGDEAAETAARVYGNLDVPPEEWMRASGPATLDVIPAAEHFPWKDAPERTMSSVSELVMTASTRRP